MVGAQVAVMLVCGSRSGNIRMAVYAGSATRRG
jgi:hypothetical protein